MPARNHSLTEMRKMTKKKIEKSLILKETTIADNKERTRIKVFGICIYERVRPHYIEERHRHIGFISYPNDAPGYIEDDDYSDEND